LDDPEAALEMLELDGCRPSALASITAREAGFEGEVCFFGLEDAAVDATPLRLLAGRSGIGFSSSFFFCAGAGGEGFGVDFGLSKTSKGDTKSKIDFFGGSGGVLLACAATSGAFDGRGGDIAVLGGPGGGAGVLDGAGEPEGCVMTGS